MLFTFLNFLFFRETLTTLLVDLMEEARGSGKVSEALLGSFIVKKEVTDGPCCPMGVGGRVIFALGLGGCAVSLMGTYTHTDTKGWSSLGT